MKKELRKYDNYTEKQKHIYFFRVTYEYNEDKVTEGDLDKFQWQFVTSHTKKQYERY